MNSSSLPSIPELQMRRDQLDKEVQVLGSSFLQLREAQDKFAQNIATLTSMKSYNDDQELMVPLTPSVYVSGRLKTKDKVLVDVGTGYYLEKDLKEADEYYVRKVKYLQEQLNMLGKVLSEKRNNLASIYDRGYTSLSNFLVITQALQMKLQDTTTN